VWVEWVRREGEGCDVLEVGTAELCKFKPYLYLRSCIFVQINQDVLDYSPGQKGRIKKPSLLSSHLLSNGAVGGEKAIARGTYL
jgi:hypothetical protein